MQGWREELAKGGFEQRHAIETLAGIERGEALPLIVDLLRIARSDPEPSVRWRSADAVKQMGPAAKDHVPEILELVRAEEHPRVRSGLIRAVATIEVARIRLVPMLVRAARSKDDEARIRALGDLAGLGKLAVSAVGDLVELLVGDPDPEVRGAAGVALKAIDAHHPEAVPAVLRGLAWARRQAHPKCARTLLGCLTGVTSREAVPLLLDVLTTSKHSDMRSEAAHAIGWNDAAGEDVLPALVRALEAEDPHERGNAAFAVSRRMSRIKKPLPQAVAPLMRLLEVEVPGYRQYAVQALAVVGPAARQAVGKLQALADGDEHADVRKAARATLAILQKAR